MLINSNGDIKVKMQNSSEGWTDNVKMVSSAFFHFNFLRSFDLFVGRSEHEFILI